MICVNGPPTERTPRPLRARYLYRCLICGQFVLCRLVKEDEEGEEEEEDDEKGARLFVWVLCSQADGFCLHPEWPTSLASIKQLTAHLRKMPFEKVPAGVEMLSSYLLFEM